VFKRVSALERYEAAFRENEIDWAVLPELTADDLKEIGVTAVGHRRKLLAAIAALPGRRWIQFHPARPAMAARSPLPERPPQAAIRGLSRGAFW